MLMMRHTSIVLLVLFVGYCLCADVLTLDGTKRELRFDGIGGLSGGGATSRFLVDYEEPYRSQILDYLFLPNFGASLQILKVEIGGDCQSTEGTEASHMHSKDDLNYQRGYEWWLMQEAKKRNPDITLYSLTWCVPGWIGNGNISNFYNQDNIDYHIKWLQGAKSVYNLTVDYMGIWNERGWEANWVVSLRGALDKNGFQNVKLVCADNGWDCYDASKKNDALKNSVAVFGAHYPGTHSIPGSTDLGKPLWASEDYSSYSDSTGGGCWGRTLNHNWVNGWMTATIAWNLISAYYNEVPYGGDGLMWAPAPWNGYYGVQSTIWVSAHTTQFTKKGDWYLTHGSGSGTLANGGSYLTLVPDNNKNGDFTLVIETFTYENSLCIRSNEAPFTVKPQSVTFQIGDALSRTKTLYVWRTQLNQNQQNSYFEQVMKITPGTNGQFSLNLGLDQVWTISTLTGQKKGTYAAPPKYSVFPNSHQDDFESYKLYSEAKYFTDQAGSFEIQQFTTNGKANKVMRQMARQPTVHWCDESEGPISVVGKYSSGDVTVQCDLLIETSTGTANIGARVLYTGCGNGYNAGYFFGISGDGSWKLYGGGKTYQSGKVNYNVNQWGTAQLSISDGNVCAHWNGAQLACVKDSSMFAGFASIGSGWNFAQFDNFKLSTGAGKKCPYNGVGVTLDVCDDSTGNQRWTLGSDGTLRLANSSSCLGVGKNVPGDNSYNAAAVVGCNPNDKNQQWKRSALQFQNVGTGKCLDVYHSNSAPCGYIGLYECGTAKQEHMWGFDDGQITNIYITPGIFCITSVN